MEQNINMGRRMQLPVLDRTLTGEITTEYSMPDYQPEIRRLLRVNATVMPPATYAGGGNAELSGTVRYDILYAAPDGQLYSATVSEDYGMSAPLDREADTVGEVVLVCDVIPDVVVSRVTAPRRLNIRTRLKARVQGFGERSVEEELRGDYDPRDLQRLTGEVMCGAFARSEVERFEMNEELTVDSSEGELRVISASAELCIGEAIAGEGTVSCRGDAIVKLLLCADGEDGVPFTVTRKLPFMETLTAEGFRSGMGCFAHAECDELRTTVEDNRIFCDIVGSVCVFGQENRPVTYTKDLFSTALECETEYCTVEYPFALKCQNGNFTQSLYEPVEGFGIEPDAAVMDLSARAAADSLTYERGKWVLSGETKLWLLMKCGEEYATQEISLPFRYEFDGEDGQLFGTSSDIRMMSGRARIDGGRLSVDCEMAVSVRLCGIKSVEMLSAATFTEPCECYRECVVCFPSESDTLWDVAKKYHTSPEHLRKLNRTAREEGGNGYLIVNE